MAAAVLTPVKNLTMHQLAGGYLKAGPLRVYVFDFQYANTYATGGGDPCDLTSAFQTDGGSGVVLAVIPGSDVTGAVIPEYDYVNEKMKAYKAGSATAAPAEYGAVNLSGSVLKNCVALGY